MNDLDLSTKLGPLSLKNPLLTASGTFGYGHELDQFISPDIFGAITLKGITIKPTQGNPSPRIVETASGIINSIGLENPGIDKFLTEKIEDLSDINTVIIANISGHTVDDFAYLAEKISKVDIISAIEINVSCPNIAGGGMIFGTDSELIYQVSKKAKNNYQGPVIIKLSPNVTDIVEMAMAAKEAGSDIVSLINTLLGMAIDAEKMKVVLGNTFGGLSGPAIKPVALRMVYQVASKVDIPIIAMGGVMNGKDAIEFLLAGADAVAIGTANLIDPKSGEMILNEIKDYMNRKDFKNIDDIKGKAIK